MKRFRRLVLICCVLSWFSPSAVWATEPSLRVALSTAPPYVVEFQMEEYLLGVLAAEVPADWPLEALKAQAVAARSYALYRTRHPQTDGYDLEATVNDQLFQLHKVYSDQLVHAVRSTRGEILQWRDQSIPAFFHSCCGGYTEQASQVWTWAKDLTFYQAKADPYCGLCPDQGWEYRMTKDEMTLLLQMNRLAGGQVDHVILVSHEETKRVQQVAIITDAETIQLSGNRFRKLFGYDRVRSTVFNVLEFGDQLLFVGSGFGHGVGLCQWGAREMALKGKRYRQILQFYYPEVELKRIY